MENRERDWKSSSDINRNKSSNLEKDESDSSVDFGEKIGSSQSWDSEPSKGEHFFPALKEDLKREWDQKDVLIVTREVSTV